MQAKATGLSVDRSFAMASTWNAAVLSVGRSAIEDGYEARQRGPDVVAAAMVSVHALLEARSETGPTPTTGEGLTTLDRKVHHRPRQGHRRGGSMLPSFSKDGKPFLPSWIYTTFGVVAFLASYANSGGDASFMVPAIGAVFCVMGLGIEVALIQSRVEKLEGDNAALRHTLHHDSSRVAEATSGRPDVRGTMPGSGKGDSLIRLSRLFEAGPLILSVGPPEGIAGRGGAVDHHSDSRRAVRPAHPAQLALVHRLGDRSAARVQGRSLVRPAVSLRDHRGGRLSRLPVDGRVAVGVGAAASRPEHRVVLPAWALYVVARLGGSRSPFDGRPPQPPDP